MENKSILTKFIELAIKCQTDHVKGIYKMIQTMPEGTEKDKVLNQLKKSYNQIMNECHQILEAEKKYKKMISN